jgi:hypothetical protein
MVGSSRGARPRRSARSYSTYTLGRVAPSSGDHLTADDQQPVIMPADETLDQHAAAKRPRDRVGGTDLGFGVQIDADAFALVAILGLDHHRQSKCFHSNSLLCKGFCACNFSATGDTFGKFCAKSFTK